MRLIRRLSTPGIHRTALTYFVRSLGLESSFHSRLARSTLLSKIDSGNPPERPVFDFRLVSLRRPVLETCCLLAASATRDEPSNISATSCCPSTFHVDFSDSRLPRLEGASLNLYLVPTGIVWHRPGPPARALFAWWGGDTLACAALASC
jgi:hypothetical protein